MFIDGLLNWGWTTLWAVFIPFQMVAAIFGYGTFGAAISGPDVTPMYYDTSEAAKLFRGIIYSFEVFFIYLLLPGFMTAAYGLSMYRVLEGIRFGADSGDSYVFVILGCSIGMVAGNIAARKVLPAIDRYFGLESKLSGPMEALMIICGIYATIKLAKAAKTVITKI